MIMVPRKKMEIFIEAIYKDFILKILHIHDVKEFICLPVIDGTKQSNEDFISNLGRICITIILEKDTAKNLLQEMKTLLKQPQAIILISDIEYIAFKEY